MVRETVCLDGLLKRSIITARYRCLTETCRDSDGLGVKAERESSAENAR
jgi:hypothetical protein